MMKAIRTLRRAALLLLALACLPSLLVAQTSSGWNSGQLEMSRHELEELLVRYEQTAQSRSSSEEMRARARNEVALIRDRLSEGDFRTGDQINLVVEGEPELSDTFIVDRDRKLVLPTIGEIPLDGVLRSELEQHLEQEIGRQIRDPVVYTTSTVRLMVDGAVGQPGFYAVPSSQLITETVMAAGGPTRNARIRKIYVERDGRKIWRGEALQDAIVEGRTLDQLNLQAGDRVVVPDSERGGVWTVLRNVALVGSAVWGITRIVRVFD